MYNQIMQLGGSPSYRRSLAARLEQERDTANNGTIPGGLASMLNAGTAAYLRAKDEGDQRRAQAAFVGGEQPTKLSTADGQQPNGPQIAAGLDGAEARLAELKGNPYAGRLSAMLAMERRQREAQDAQLAEQRAYQESLYTRDRNDRLQDIADQRQWTLSNRAPKQRRIVPGADGYQYYADTGERVLPGVQAPPKKREQVTIGGVPYYVDTGNPVIPGVGPERKAPTVRTVKQPNGSEVAVQYNPETGEWDPLNAPGGGAAVVDPRAKLSENQSKLTLFKTNMEQVGPLLNQMEQNGYDPTNFGDAAAKAWAPAVFENYLKSNEGQQYQTLAAQWAEGALRIATGAAATQPEIVRNVQTYFPQPGDSDQTVTLKQQMRAAYQRSIEAALGDLSAVEPIASPDAFAARYAQRLKGTAAPSSPLSSTPKRRRYNPTTGKFEDVR